MAKKITREELHALMDIDAVTLVEALPVMHYEAEHLPGAMNVPDRLTPDLASRIAPDTTRTVVSYCSGPTCGRSKATAVQFERLGYTDVRVYLGGKSDWSDAGLPLDHSHAATT